MSVKSDLNECVTLLGQILTFVFGTVPSSASIGTPGAQIKSDIGNLLADAADEFVAGTALASLNNCFQDATNAGATLERMSGCLTQILALAPVSQSAIALVNAAIVYCLSQEAKIIAATTYTSRNEVELVLTQLQLEFCPAIETAADALQSDVYQALIALQGAITSYLVITQQPLPYLMEYSFAKRLPSLVMAQKLYSDPSRANELRQQNQVIEPAFMPYTGVALSS